MICRGNCGIQEESYAVLRCVGIELRYRVYAQFDGIAYFGVGAPGET